MWPNFPPIIFPSENFIWSDKVRSRGDYTSAFVSFTKQLIFKNVRLKVCIVFDSFFLRSLFSVSFAPNFPKTLLWYPEKTSLPPFLFGTFSGRGQALKKQPWKNKANHRRLGYNALKRFDFCKLHFFHLSKLPQIITVLKSLQRWTLPLKGNCPVILGVGGSFCFLEGSSRRNSEPPKKKQTATAGSFPVPQRCLKQNRVGQVFRFRHGKKKNDSAAWTHSGHVSGHGPLLFGSDSPPGHSSPLLHEGASWWFQASTFMQHPRLLLKKFTPKFTWPGGGSAEIK